MRIKFAIPSYKRADKQLSLAMLNGFGYGVDDIVLSTQTEDDYAAYRDRYGDKCKVVYRHGNSVTQNRNNCLEQFRSGEWVVMLDDDISGFYMLKNGGGLEKVDDIEKLFVSFFASAVKNNAPMWGVYPVMNDYFMKPTIDKRNIVNSCLGIINRVRFDERYIAKEDIELCCRVISEGKNVLRFNFVTYDVKHKQSGGCSDTWKTDANKIVAERLVRQYPSLLRINTKREGEVLFRGKK